MSFIRVAYWIPMSSREIPSVIVGPAIGRGSRVTLGNEESRENAREQQIQTAINKSAAPRRPERRYRRVGKITRHMSPHTRR